MNSTSTSTSTRRHPAEGDGSGAEAGPGREQRDGPAQADPGGTANGRKPLRVAAVADLHVHKIHHGQYRSLFAEISEKADVLVIAGDLTNLGLPEEAENLATDLGTLRIPAVAVPGNHDHHSGRVEEMKQVLARANVTFLDDETFVLNDVGFAGVKGFGGGFARHMLGSFGEEATKHFVTEAVSEGLRLETALNSLDTPRRVVAMHYSPVLETVVGESPEIYAFLGCSRLAETIDRFDVAAVFHGHAHHGQPEGRTGKGIPVYNCSIEVYKRMGGAWFTVVEV